MTPVCARSRLIVALDLPTVEEAEGMVGRLGDAVSFFKIGLWLLHARGIDRLIDRLVDGGKRVFLDCKMFDIGETVREGVRRAAERGASLVTVHGNDDILAAAVEGKGGSAIEVFAISALTSLDDEDLRRMGHACPLSELVELRVRAAMAHGCDGVIAAPRDAARIREIAPPDALLLATPGVRPAGSGADDHKRGGTPAAAVAGGADYVVAGRPVVRALDPPAAARAIAAEMQAAFDARREEE